METIKFYRQFKNGKYFISGKNENDKWFFLNKEHNKDLYLDYDKFKNGLSIDKIDLKLKDGTENVLILKNEEIERKYCITKEEVEERKKKRKIESYSPFDYVNEIIKEIIVTNDLLCGQMCEKLFLKKEEEKEELEEIDANDLPF